MVRRRHVGEIISEIARRSGTAGLAEIAKALGLSDFVLDRTRASMEAQHLVRRRLDDEEPVVIGATNKPADVIEMPISFAVAAE